MEGAGVRLAGPLPSVWVNDTLSRGRGPCAARRCPQLFSSQRARPSQAAFGRYVDRLARALATVINVLDPQVIVLGGGMSNVTELYEQASQRWAAQVFSDSVRTALRPAQHGDSSGVRGAAWLAGADLSTL